MKNMFLALLAVVVLFASGCSLLDEEAPYPEGLKGAACDYSSQCISNSCVYPGVCE